MSRRRIVGVFVAVTFVPAVTSLWLGSRLLEQDNRLALQYAVERREQAVERAVTKLQAAISDSALFLGSQGSGTMLLRYPAGPRLFQAEPPTLTEASEDAYREGEEIENRGDWARAAEVYLRMTPAKDPAIRAGAWLRLARVYRKSSRFPDALSAYGELERIENVSVAGWPATLAAAWGRCALLEGQRNEAELRTSADWLRRRLDSGYWAISRTHYEIFAEDAARWTGIPRPQEAEALTQVSNALWERIFRGDDGPEGRRFIVAKEGAVTLLWKPAPEGTVIFAATQAFVERAWLDGTGEIIWLQDENGKTLGDAKSTDFVLRYPAETKLPWTVAIAPRPAGNKGFGSRKQMLLSLLGVVALFTLTGSYFFLRTLRRDFALARMQSDFVSAVSHEFRTPLTSMRMITEALVDERIPDAERMRESFHSLSRATQRLHRLVEDLLDFRRMESGAMEFRMKPVDAMQAVQRVTEEFRKEVEQRGFRVRVAARAEARIRGDENAISRALWNLLDNAAKYSGESRDIDVSLNRDGPRVLVSVVDGGIGIPPEERARLFTKFYRGAEAKRSEIPGTGIGLAMVAHIAAAHGGKVWVMSEPGQGSTFTMSFPVEDC